MNTFRGSAAIVTGASSGIGLSTSLALARAGARVALVARRKEPLEETAKQVRDLGGEALVLPADVSDAPAVGKAVEKAAQAFGRLDLLVANAGVIARKGATQLTPKEYAWMMEVNFLGSVYPTLAALPLLKKQRSGSIAFVSSLAGKLPTPTRSGYSASKFALNGFVEALRAELVGTGVHTTLVCPGFVETPMIADLKHMRGSPFFRPVSPERVARAVLYGVRWRRAEVFVPAYMRGALFFRAITPASWWSRAIAQAFPVDTEGGSKIG